MAPSALPFPEVDWQSRKSLAPSPSCCCHMVSRGRLPRICHLPSSRICKYPVPLSLCVTCKDNQEKRKRSRVTIAFKDLANMILSVISLVTHANGYLIMLFLDETKYKS